MFRYHYGFRRIKIKDNRPKNRHSVAEQKLAHLEDDSKLKTRLYYMVSHATVAKPKTLMKYLEEVESIEEDVNRYLYHIRHHFYDGWRDRFRYKTIKNRYKKLKIYLSRTKNILKDEKKSRERKKQKEISTQRLQDMMGKHQ